MTRVACVLQQLLRPQLRAAELPSAVQLESGKIAWRSHYGGVIRSVAPVLWWLGLAVSYAALMLSFAFVWLLARLVSALGSAEPIAPIACALAAIAVARLTCQALRIAVELVLSERLAVQIGSAVARFHLLEKPRDQIPRLLGRDLPLALDSLGASFDLIALPAGLITGLTYFAATESSLGVLAVLPLALFVPLSWQLARSADRVFSAVMRFAADRLERCRAWFREGPVLLNWDRTAALDEIEHLAAREVRLRNWDSVLRGADNYLAGFGKALPFALLAGALLWLERPSDQLFALFWLAIPLLSMLLDLPRAYVLHRNGSRALRELAELSFAEPAAVATELRVDERWELWSGTLESNLLVRPPGLDGLLSYLGLSGELGATPAQVRAHVLQGAGRNLSAGQRVRVLIARAVSLALARDCPVCLDLELSSLDRSSQQRVERLGEVFPELRLRLSARALRSLRESAAALRYDGAPVAAAVTGRSVRAVSPREASAVGRSLREGVRSAGWILLLPAALLSATGYLAAQTPSWTSLVLLCGASLFGIGLGIAGGYAIESRIRQRGLELLLRGLRQVKDGESLHDEFQIVSRDFDTVNERVAWYAHDACWIGGLLLCSLASAVWILGVWGATVATLTGAAYVWLWKTRLPEVVRSRTDSVHGVNRLLATGEDVAATAGLDEAVAGALRSSQVRAGLLEFLQKRSRMLISKSSLAFYALAFTEAATVALALLVGGLGPGPGAAALLFTTLLAVDADILRFFLALSGMRSQRIALERLFAFAQGDPERYRPLAKLRGAELAVPSFETLQSGLCYRSVLLERGCAYSVTGRSGCGKSQFLKALAGMVPSRAPQPADGAPVPVIYVDRRLLPLEGSETLRDVGAVSRALAALAERGSARILVLDEALTACAPDQVRQIVARIALESGSGLCILLVDHRLVLPESVAIESLLAAGAQPPIHLHPPALARLAP